jgi:hypothetical protein
LAEVRSTLDCGSLLPLSATGSLLPALHIHGQPAAGIAHVTDSSHSNQGRKP